MYLSSLEIDVHSVRGRMWLASPYRIHQRLCLAFPDGSAGRVLYRIEAEREPPRIIVQSPVPADWDRSFCDHPVLVVPPAQKAVSLNLRAGQRLRFVVRANPTARRLAPRRVDSNGKRPVGPRVGVLREEEQRAWLIRKGEAGGFRPLAFEARSAGQIAVRRGTGDEPAVQTHMSVDFMGYLEVVDPTTFVETLAKGIGAAKAFGFGLMMVAPA